jgi:hypothetical protein
MNIDWKPRYYYIMQNKTSGKKYVGQTTQDISKYRGSGPYWTNHCKKHGGYTRENIELLEYQWFEKEEDAKKWLEYIEEHNGNYWKLVEWANQVPENTLDNPFYSKKVQKAIRENLPEDIKKECKRKFAEGGKPTRFGAEKFITNIIQKYGVDNVMKVPEIAKRSGITQSITKKINGTAKGSNNGNAKNVVVNGLSFGTMKDASIHFGISMHYLRKHNINNIINIDIEYLRLRTELYGSSNK